MAEKFTGFVRIGLILGVLWIASSLAIHCDAREEQEATFQSLLEKGKSEFSKDYKDQDFSMAVKYLEEAVKLKPENQEVHYFLGYAYERLSAKDGGQMLDSSLELTRKSSAHFEKVIELSPTYTGELVVSDPYSKLTSIWGSMAMAYIAKGQVDSARWAFEQGRAQGGFIPALLEFNKNIMRSCQKNAILFTNGDNDTYPTWYLQLMEDFRKDITIVNLSLLNTPWYVKQTKNAYPFGSNNIPVSLSDSAIDALAPRYWSEQTVKIPVPDDPENEEGKMTWLVKPTLMKKAVRVQDLMVIHILEANEWKRPIYFSATVARINLIGLDEYLALQGLALRLVSHKTGYVSKADLYENCLDHYTYEGTHDEHLKYSPDVNLLYTNYHSIFASLAAALHDDGETEKAKLCLKTMRQKIPVEIVPYRNAAFEEKIKSLEEKVFRE